MSQDSPQKPKLIIDEDWKSQVAREKEQSRKAASGQSESHPEAVAEAATEDQESAYDPAKLPPPPPASLAILFSTLGTQALAAMGQLPGGKGPAPAVRLDYAKHYIDMLGLLEEKTKGNLSPEESHLLGDWVHELRMAYVALSSRK